MHPSFRRTSDAGCWNTRCSITQATFPRASNADRASAGLTGAVGYFAAAGRATVPIEVVEEAGDEP